MANINVRATEFAALLHDVADHKFGYSDEDRDRIISDFLKTLKIPQDEITFIVEIVNTCSFSWQKKNGRLTKPEAQIISDADRIESNGATAIARTFDYGGMRGRPIYEEGNNECSIQHFYDKLLILKDLMYFPYGKELALGRHKFLELYLEQFWAEYKGEK